MLICLLPLVACDRDYDGVVPDGPGSVYGRVHGLLGANLGDVRVCQHGVDNCMTTEGDGEFLIEGLPEDSDVVITMEKEGHLPTAFQHHTSNTMEWDKLLMPIGIVEQMGDRIDTTMEPDKGHVLFILWTGPDYDEFDRVEGISVEGPGQVFYQGGGLGLSDPELDATTSNGGGGLFNLEPGRVELTFSEPCESFFSLEFEAGEAVPVDVIEGFGSYFDLVCPQP